MKWDNKEIEHNDRKWEVCTNRHPNTDGTSWGWIDGTDIKYNLCWSNNKPWMDRKKAEELCKNHNDWLARKDLKMEAPYVEKRSYVDYIVKDQFESRIDGSIQTVGPEVRGGL